MIFTKDLDFIAHNQILNMTFLNNILLSVENPWLYHLAVSYYIIHNIHNLFYYSSSQTQVTWNTGSIPYVPTNHTTTCVERTLYPAPGPIQDLNITSCFSNGSHVTLHLEWSPPPVITVELDSYAICIGESLVYDQEMSGPNNGSCQCSDLKFNVC